MKPTSQSRDRALGSAMPMVERGSSDGCITNMHGFIISLHMSKRKFVSHPLDLLGSSLAIVAGFYDFSDAT